MRPNLIRGLAVFCAAARYLSFKMAAEELFITPSAVSHQIKNLEDQLGGALFERRTRAIVLTPLGASIYGQVDPLLRSLDAVIAEFAGIGRGKRVLRITVPPLFASEILVPQLAEFIDGHPSVEIRIDTTAMREGEFPTGCDAAVLLLTSPPSEEEAIPLFGVKLVPACSPALSRDIDFTRSDALCESTLIVHEASVDAWSDWFELLGLETALMPSVVQFDSMLSVIRAAERGIGVALVPVPLAAGWFQSGALVRLFDSVLDTGERYFFVRRLASVRDRDIDSLTRWLQAVCSVHD